MAALASSGSSHGRLQNAAAHGGARTARTPATSCEKKTQREENPPEEDRCAPGGKKTQPKKTAFSNRLNYHTFRTAMTYSKVQKELRQVGKFLLRRWKHFNLPKNSKAKPVAA